MSKRIVGAAVFGAGVFSLVAAVGLAFLITPLISKIPYDLEPVDSSLDAPAATFVQPKLVDGALTLAVEHADLRVDAGIRPDAKATAELAGSLAGRAVIWSVYQVTRRADTDDLIGASQSRIALDRVSGAAVDWSGQCLTDQDGVPCQAGSANFSGHVHKFPFGTKKQTYEYYDSGVRAPLPMAYRGTDTVDGLEAYRFEQVVPEQEVEMRADDLGVLLSAFAPDAATGSVLYRSTRTVWVEPVTGSIVDYQDAQHRVLVADTGSRTVLFDAILRYSPETRESVVDSAARGRLAIRALGRYVPIGLALFGILLLAWGFRLIARATPAGVAATRTPARHAVDPYPQPAGDGPDRTESVV